MNLAAGRAETALAELEEAAATQASTARTAIWRYFALAQLGRADEARDARDEIIGREAADLNLRIQMHAALCIERSLCGIHAQDFDIHVCISRLACLRQDRHR